MANWLWRSRSMTPVFNTTIENPKMYIWCKLGYSISNPSYVIARTSQISGNSKSNWPKWPWRSRSMTYIFNSSREYPIMHVCCKFGDSSQFCDNLPRGQGGFPRILSQNDLEGKVNDIHFQYQLRASHDACFCAIWRLQHKSVMSYRAVKEKFTDGRADGRTQATTMPFRPERPSDVIAYPCWD